MAESLVIFERFLSLTLVKIIKRPVSLVGFLKKTKDHTSEIRKNGDITRKLFWACPEITSEKGKYAYITREMSEYELVRKRLTNHWMNSKGRTIEKTILGANRPRLINSDTTCYKYFVIEFKRC